MTESKDMVLRTAGETLERTNAFRDAVLRNIQEARQDPSLSIIDLCINNAIQ